LLICLRNRSALAAHADHIALDTAVLLPAATVFVHESDEDREHGRHVTWSLCTRMLGKNVLLLYSGLPLP